MDFHHGISGRIHSMVPGKTNRRCRPSWLKTELNQKKSQKGIYGGFQDPQGLHKDIMGALPSGRDSFMQALGLEIPTVTFTDVPSDREFVESQHILLGL